MRARLKALLYEQLAQGVDPRKLALTCAVGISCGSFPLIGFTTLLCLGFGVALKLNQPLLQALNFLMGPIQLVLIPVFGYAGMKLGRPLNVDPHPQAIVQSFAAGPAEFLKTYGELGLRAVLVWALTVPILAAVIYKFSLNHLRGRVPS